MKKQLIITALKDCSATCCISYTLVSLILSLLNTYNNLMADDAWKHNLELFTVCFVIALLMFLMRIIMKQDEVPRVSLGIVAADLLIVAAPVLGLGGFVFHWFDVFSPQVLFPIGILLIVYALTATIFYFSTKKTEKELNRKINERKERLNHGQQDHSGN